MESLESLNHRLFESVQAGDPEAAQDALSRGANANAIDAHGWAALHYSSANGDIDVCDVLVHWGGDVNLTLPDFSTPLMLTLEEGHVPVAKLLLEGGARVKCRDENGFTAQERCDPKAQAELAKLMQQLPASARGRRDPAATNPPGRGAREAGLGSRPPGKDWRQA